MVWTEEHDILLCHEVMTSDLTRFKSGTRERGNCWDRIATILNGFEKPTFKVDQRAVRDRTTKLMRDFKRKIAKLEAADGVIPEMTVLDDILQRLTEKMEGNNWGSERNDYQNTQNFEEENGTSEIFQRLETESIEEKNEAEAEDEAPIVKKKRVNESQDVAQSLSLRQGIEMKMKKMELELKHREVTLKEVEQKQQYELKKRELDLKEKEQEDKRQEDLARREKETKLINLIQQQQLIFSQFYQQNQLILKSLTNK